ncbi:MAG: molybdopterin-dependent oxidoreductase, partial [Dehalococcoidia bacterium]|nr:molybdopterin-dependent oxidoreductase [Dehalococcoidia bacterium]
AGVLDMPENKIRVVSVPGGGAFGGKWDAPLFIHLALLSRKTGKPVRMAWSREESIFCHPKRHPARIAYKMGATREGKITAIQASIVADGGAYTSASAAVIRVMGSYIAGPYNIPHIRIEGKVAFTNTPISGAMRGFGGPQAVTATEVQVDALARELGIGPVELRTKNLLKQGDTPAMAGVILDGRVTLLDTVDAALKRAGPLQKPSGPHKKTGRGLACGMPIWDAGGMPAYHRRGTGAGVEMLPDGSVVVFSGACELGTGISTVLAQIAAEELGVALEQVSVICGDSLVSPKAGPTVASRSTYTAGNAVCLAAQKLKATVLEKASSMLEAPSAILKIAEGCIYVEEAPERTVQVREVAAACFEEGTTLRSDSWFSANHAPFGQTFMTSLADVEVDIETGEVTVLSVVAAHDIGKAINPLNTRGQLLGGALQGIGYALQEDLCTEKSFVKKESFSEYIILGSMDMPQRLQEGMVEEPYATGPYGAKAVGEHGMVTAPPAVLNAIYDAVGIRILNPPATPDKVLKALRDAGRR